VDLIAGQVEVGFDSLPATIEHIRVGQLRALAISTAKQNEALPAFPPLANSCRLRIEFMVRHRRAAQYAERHRRRLNAEINAALADPKIKARIATLAAPR